MVTKKKKEEEELREELSAIVAPSPPPADAPKVFRDADTGRVSGVEIEGKVFRGGREEVEKLTEFQQRKTATPEGAVELSRSKGERVLATQARQELKERGALEDVTPREIDLQAEPAFGEEIPGIGKSTAALQSVLANAARKGFIPPFKPGPEAVTGEDVFQPPETPESLREGALREIRIKSFDKGVSLSESLGALIEAIPLVGGAVGRYVGGLVEAPFANAKNALDNINKIKEAASTGQEKVRNGLEDPGYGLDRARDMEEKLARLQGRIKILRDTSAILRANSDEVNTIEEQILEAEEKVARYRQAAEFGFTAQLTGTGRVIPTDEQLFFELEDIERG